jgi:hypothetical protein
MQPEVGRKPRAAKGRSAMKERVPKVRIPKIRATFHIPEELFEEARDAVVHLSGPPTRLTLADLCETALRRELERLRKTHGVGERFPKRDGDLKGGRPIGS